MIYVCLTALVGLLVSIVYGCHCLFLYLERRGYMYYWHTKPRSGLASAWIPLDELTQPQVRHVREVAEEKRTVDEENGQGEPLRDVRVTGAPSSEDSSTS